MMRGVRGATTVTADTAEMILDAARELLQAIIESNQIEEEYVASVIFTTTPDLTAAFPARAARELGWQQTALMGGQEMDVPGGLPRCIRVLVHWNTTKALHEVNHIFLREAVALRPDLISQEKPVMNGRGQS